MPRSPHRQNAFTAWCTQFWRRVTTGLELNQLWSQFLSDTRASYHLYSREVDFAKPHDVPKGRHFFNVARQFFWAVLEQLSPARRVLLLLALLLIILSGEAAWHGKEGLHILNFDFRLTGALLLLLLLLLEVTDRVVMKRDLQIAREIQTWLLPSTPPEVEGLDIAFAARPANTVAGDYYDVFPRAGSSSAPHSFLFAVADVAGKSIPAALLMASVQASLKTLSTTSCSLQQLVDGMNRYVCGNSQGGRRFVTAFLAEYVPADRTLTYINAGHNPPLLLRSPGTIERLEAGGLPLGIEPGAVYQSGQITLSPGDWLAMFTDGLVEATNQNDEEYGEQRVIACLHSSAATATATSLISQIMVGLDVFVGGNLPLADDVTCVLVHGV
jgi:sigma-B regulation protein RsbU (phosphoserine phosphatase)